MTVDRSLPKFLDDTTAVKVSEPANDNFKPEDQPPPAALCLTLRVRRP